MSKYSFFGHLLRVRNPTQKKQKILHAACELFAKKGVAGTTTAQIASLAGVAHGTLFRYFATKEDLANELYRFVANLYAEYLKLDPERLSAQQDFESLLTGMYRFYLERRYEFLFFEGSSHVGYLDEKSIAIRAAHKSRVADLVMYWQSDGVLVKIEHEVVRALAIGSFYRMVREAEERMSVVENREFETLKRLLLSALI